MQQYMLLYNSMYCCMSTHTSLLYNGKFSSTFGAIFHLSGQKANRTILYPLISYARAARLHARAAHLIYIYILIKRLMLTSLWVGQLLQVLIKH